MSQCSLVASKLDPDRFGANGMAAVPGSRTDRRSGCRLLPQAFDFCLYKSGQIDSLSLCPVILQEGCGQSAARSKVSGASSPQHLAGMTMRFEVETPVGLRD